MNEKAENIIEFCQSKGVDVLQAAQRIKFKTCPACGNENWKVWFFEDTMRGSCFRCHYKYSIFLYLIQCGFTRYELKDVFNYGSSVSDLSELLLIDDKAQEENVVEEINEITLDTSRFIRIEDRPNHMASQYAIKRGVRKSLRDQILIDTYSNSVAFLCHKNNILTGYQLRYVVPKDPKVKTYTMKGFKTGQNIIHYQRKNADICICEGPFNAVTSYNWGFNSFACFGSNISNYHIQQIINEALVNKSKVYCAFDKDEAGKRAFLQTKFLCDIYNIEVIKMEPEIGNDLNESWMNNGTYNKVLNYEFCLQTELKLI